ncbi:MAG: class I SAM-dependent methyltransferase [Hyphomicrobiales bacterium]
MEHKNWTDGYSSDVTYTKGYYKTQSPRNIALAILARGFMPPKLENFRYLELGFGQGLSFNIHAAALNGEFWGCDFNPQHALHAQKLATASGADARVLNDSFEELLARDDLPEFDYISMHGVWTWVSDKNREAILELLRRKLKVGGALQVSYNCQPGWAPVVPLVNLMKLHKEVTAVASEDPRESFRKAIEFANVVSQTDARFFAANPDAKAHLEALKNQDTNYLVHEYFHDF